MTNTNRLQSIRNGATRRVSIVLIVVAMSTACAAKRQPLVWDPQMLGVQTITLLPVVDGRRERSDRYDLEDLIGNAVRGILGKRGYRIVSFSRFSESGDVPM